MSEIAPSIIPTNNSNGVRIQNIGFSTITKDVTVTLEDQFSVGQTFPFVVGDNVLIENISVGVGSTARGYNSSEYGYQRFAITAIPENPFGGVGIVTYSLSNYFATGEDTPGTFDAVNSSGRIIAEKLSQLLTYSYPQTIM